MNIEWKPPFGGDRELIINDVCMGWVDACNAVHCMWMTCYAEEDPREHLLQSQYPEGHAFETGEQAKAALLESAVPIYIGGFRGR